MFGAANQDMNIPLIGFDDWLAIVCAITTSSRKKQSVLIEEWQKKKKKREMISKHLGKRK